MALTRHCHHCGWIWNLSVPPSRTENCHECGADMRICLNCVHYDSKVAWQCREKRADPVAEKDRANFCEYFDFIRREYIAADGGNSREDAARDALKKLLGD